MNNTYVYVYLDSRKPGNFQFENYSFNFEPFYVGKGVKTRYLDHVKKAVNRSKKDPNPFKRGKIQHILKEGLSPIIFFTSFGLSDEEACLEEIRLIQLIGRANKNLGPLTNLTDGGDTMAGFEFKKESLQKMSRNKTGSKNSMFGKHHSEESNRSNSEKHKKYFEDPSHREASSRVMKKYYSSPENRKKVSERKKNTAWVNNSLEDRSITLSELENYIKNGWIRGRMYVERIVVSTEAQKEIIKLYQDEGKSVAEIQKITGIKKIKKILINNKVPLRSRSKSTQIGWNKRKKVENVNS